MYEHTVVKGSLYRTTWIDFFFFLKEEQLELIKSFRLWMDFFFWGILWVELVLLIIHYKSWISLVKKYLEFHQSNNKQEISSYVISQSRYLLNFFKLLYVNLKLFHEISNNFKISLNSMCMKVVKKRILLCNLRYWLEVKRMSFILFCTYMR